MSIQDSLYERRRDVNFKGMVPAPLPQGMVHRGRGERAHYAGACLRICQRRAAHHMTSGSKLPPASNRTIVRGSRWKVSVTYPVTQSEMDTASVKSPISKANTRPSR